MSGSPENMSNQDDSAKLDNAVVACIQDQPLEGQTVQHGGKLFNTVKEGLAHILVPESAKTPAESNGNTSRQENVQSVFYNPIQQFNRDLSVLAIRAYADDLMAVREQRASAKAARGTKRKRKGPNKIEQNQPQQQTSNAMGTNGGTDLVKDQPVHVAESTPEVQHHADALLEGSTNRPSADSGEDPMAVACEKGTNSRVVEVNGGGHERIKPMERPAPRRSRFRILDALSATGLRALRYAQEIPEVTSVTANDISKDATASIEANVTYNRLGDIIKVVTSNAMSHMYNTSDNADEHSNPSKYDVIDLDPYGTAAPFLDAAVQAVSDGGLLCVTCTDSALWASCGYPEKTYSLYGGSPIKGLHSHEGGLRLILHAIASAAARYGRSIEPLLSLSIDFYARVFVRVYQSPAEVKLLASRTMIVYSCDGGCGAWATQLLGRSQSLPTKGDQIVYKHGLAQGPSTGAYCEHCGSKTHLSGPMYAGGLHHPAFIQSILSQLPTLDTSTYQTVDRLEGMLTTALEEVQLRDDDLEAHGKGQNNSAEPAHQRPVPRLNPAYVDRNPFYFVPSALTKVIHSRAPSEAEVRGALKHAGYAVTRSHARPGTIKTDAPWGFVWHMMREWARQKAPIKEGAIKITTPGHGIMRGAEARRRDHSHSSGSSDAQTTTNHVNGDTQMDRSQEHGKPAHDGKPIVFDEVLGKQGNNRRLKRYQENPRPNWGPMNRAKR